MLAGLLVIFYKTAHKDTGKLKSLVAEGTLSNGESLFPVLNR